MPVAGALVVLNGVLLVAVALEADVLYWITLLGVDRMGVELASCVFSCFLSDLEW